jgi:hypothetical protein
MAAFPFLQPFPKKTTNHQINNPSHFALLQKLSIDAELVLEPMDPVAQVIRQPCLASLRGNGIGYYAGAYNS